LLPDRPKVLDAGCGNGRISKILDELGIDVVRLDISTGLLQIARENNPNIDFVEGNLLSL